MRKQMVQAEKKAIRCGDTRWLKKLEAEINTLLDKEAKMWSLRARVNWLKDEDRNTRFFHSKASQRRRRNYIKRLFDLLGQWTTQPNQVVNTAINIYQQLFTTSNPKNLKAVLAEIPQLVTIDMNATLTSTFTADEVERALKQMERLKSPGPDGMPPLFYQNYWSLVGNDVKEAILLYLNTGSLPKTLGHSFITLIPKVKNLEYISQYRPISLNNVLYRVFSKVLANRLKLVLPHIISEQQSAFLIDQLISDNILVAFETLHYVRNYCTGKTGYMALKLDMSKAYDQVEWNYMEKLMVKMGFCSSWVKL